LPREEVVDAAERISDPEGHGPSIWLPVVPDAEAVKNRLHLDIHASGERKDPIEIRRNRVDAEAARLAGLGATITGALPEEGLDHYAVGMKDPEGNEFDINDRRTEAATRSRRVTGQSLHIPTRCGDIAPYWCMGRRHGCSALHLTRRVNGLGAVLGYRQADAICWMCLRSVPQQPPRTVRCGKRDRISA